MKRLTSIFLILLLLLAGCAQSTPTPNPSTSQTPKDQTVRDAFEALNGQTTSNGKQYLDVHLPDNNVFSTISKEDTLEFLKSGTGVIVFEFPECPWCRNAMPVIDEVARKLGMKNVYSFNIREERNEIELQDGKPVVVNEGTDFYRQVLEILGDNLPVYEGLNDESLRRIYVPLVIVLKDGVVQSTHLSTVDSQKDPYVALTPEQHAELSDIYQRMFMVLPECKESEPVC